MKTYLKMNIDRRLNFLIYFFDWVFQTLLYIIIDHNY